MRVMLLKLPRFHLSCVSISWLLLLFFCFFLFIDQVRVQQSSNTCEKQFDNVRFPIKPRTMAQAQIPNDISADDDITPVEKCMR